MTTGHVPRKLGETQAVTLRLGSWVLRRQASDIHQTCKTKRGEKLFNFLYPAPKNIQGATWKLKQPSQGGYDSPKEMLGGTAEEFLAQIVHNLGLAGQGASDRTIVLSCN